MIEEPFGPALFADIPDLDAFQRKTIRAAISGFDVRAHRAAAAARPITYYGGPTHWEAPQMAEAA
jgi:hypothetical protein